MPARVGVCAAGADESLHKRAQALAAELHLPLVHADDTGCDLLTAVTAKGLELRETGTGAAGGVRADFGLTGAGARRLETASRRQPLARAVGLKQPAPIVVDATAGLGADTMLLAQLGCTVIAIERCPVVAALLRDALQRAATVPARRAAVSRVTLVVADAAGWLARISADRRPDVVYLDPMLPPRRKTALPGKEMRLLRRLVGHDPDAADLLAAARAVARRRVVVKRTPHAPPLAPGVSMSCRGKLVRYDIYLNSPRK